ncbi:MAG: hypothetical protein A3K19_15250 [Lentisphaerae bacterium RIFOXYB12_FULL_65_16]|nr:MAG: hypothetical protein A3K18_06950 [Lentisphaerae bacterium RIFOXYA12_64_32]OGV88448.1 MAG: hypothetical protein A3K19_15250 [Lentisphaerae bacterium RIFOXYB12_FULL_65_16]
MTRPFSLSVALAVACTAAVAAPTLVLQDDFSAYPNQAAPPAEAWESVSGAWCVSDGRLGVSADSAAVCLTRRVPELDALEYTARIVVRERVNTAGWATAGIALYLDTANNWRLNLVEGPDRKRYAEFGETLEGKWKANADGPTQLVATEDSKTLSGEWQYGTEYVMRIILSTNDIYGSITQIDGALVARYRYAWGGADSIRFGRPGMGVTGFSSAFGAVTVTAELPVAAGATAGAQPGRDGRVALLKDAIPGVDPARCDTLAATLRHAGLDVTFVSGTDLAAFGRFNAVAYECLLVAGTRYFPVAARENLLRFLRNGGHLAVLGGNVFEEPVAFVNDRWMSGPDVATALRAVKPQNLLFDFESGDVANWSRSTDNKPAASALAADIGPIGRCLRIQIEGLNNWDTFATPIPPFPAGHSLLCFQAKGDATTSQVAVELDESDGSRWIATVDITPEWAEYVLAPTEFAVWEPKSKAARQFNPAAAARLSFGLASSHTSKVPKGTRALWVDTVGTAPNPYGNVDLSRRIELNLFSDYEPYRLPQIASVVTAPGLTISVPPVEIKGAFSGRSAVGFAFQNESAFIPLLTALDARGRDRGWAGGMLVNYAGLYGNSVWTFFGIDSREFYTEPGFLDTLVAVLKTPKPALVESARTANAAAKTRELPLTTPAPAGFIRVTPDGKHLAYPDGRRFFAIGCNYVGPFDRCCKLWRDEFFTVDGVEDDFRKAHEAGLNCMRYWLWNVDKDIAKGDLRKIDAIKECARRYGVYLLINLPGTGYATVEDMLASHAAIAGAFADEPMVLGYDLRNEPYIGTVAGIQYPEQAKPAVLTTRFLDTFATELNSEAIHSTLKNRPNWLHFGTNVQGADAENALAAIMLWDKYARKYSISSTTFPGIDGALPPDDAYAPVVQAVDASFGHWVKLQVDAIRAVDRNHLITVGYNLVFSCLPSNRQLDFVSQHVYARPFSYADVMENITTLDRLAKVWPDKPITFGEFGYSNGVPMPNSPDGYLDRYTSSVGEMMHYLYAFAKGYDGCKKWMLNDWPYPIMRRYGDWDKGLQTRIYEERFGLYVYDGTPTGRPKPIAHALRCFSEYAAHVAQPGGTIEITPADLCIGAAYVYRNADALFVGNTSYQSDALSFTATQPANVMLWWDDKTLHVLATADAQVTVTPSALGPFGGTLAAGKCSSIATDGKTLRLGLLEGEPVLIR